MVKKGFHRSSTAEWRGVETTVTISQCVPIIFCPLVVSCSRAKVKELQVSRNNRVTEFVKLWLPQQVKDAVWKDFGFTVSKTEKGEKVTENNMQTLVD